MVYQQVHCIDKLAFRIKKEVDILYLMTRTIVSQKLYAAKAANNMKKIRKKLNQLRGENYKNNHWSLFCKNMNHHKRRGTVVSFPLHVLHVTVTSDSSAVHGE